MLVAWLAWCRYGVVPLPRVFTRFDRIFRIVSGATTYLLTDTTGHITGIPMRNRAALAFRSLLRHLGADLRPPTLP